MVRGGGKQEPLGRANVDKLHSVSHLLYKTAVCAGTGLIL